MLIAATADLHGHFPTIPECDVLVIAGDITPTVSHDLDFQARWLNQEFRQWLEAVPATHVVGVAGNHDFAFQRAPNSVPADLQWTYLEDSTTTIDGVRFWGRRGRPGSTAGRSTHRRLTPTRSSSSSDAGRRPRIPT